MHTTKKTVCKLESARPAHGVSSGYCCKAAYVGRRPCWFILTVIGCRFEFSVVASCHFRVTVRLAYAFQGHEQAVTQVRLVLQNKLIQIPFLPLDGCVFSWSGKSSGRVRAGLMLTCAVRYLGVNATRYSLHSSLYCSVRFSLRGISFLTNEGTWSTPCLV